MTKMPDDDMKEVYAEMIMEPNEEYSHLIWPLSNSKPIFPPPHGRFAAKRKHDIHTGFDLYADESEPVLAMENGIVLDVIHFTGPEAGSPWWLPTQAVIVSGQSGVILYGEVTPSVQKKTILKPPPALAAHEGFLPFWKHTPITKGQHIGNVARVLRNDKGLPMSMLHVEVYDSPSQTRTVTCCELWTDINVRPEGLRDPWPILKKFFPDV